MSPAAWLLYRVQQSAVYGEEGMRMNGMEWVERRGWGERVCHIPGPTLEP